MRCPGPDVSSLRRRPFIIPSWRFLLLAGAMTIGTFRPTDLCSAPIGKKAHAPAATPATVQPKRIPPPGIEVPAAKREELERRLAELSKDIEGLEHSSDRRIRELVPDVRIFWQAVETALVDHEFFATNEIDTAIELLLEARARAADLKAGVIPWTAATGLVVRGYVSRLDGSVQPYGLVVPESYTPSGTVKYRLDLWFHGRGEKLSEVNFLRSRQKDPGTFAPRDTIVLHPYGRYCNANHFAGEVDVFEAIESVKKRYRIDDDRIVARGFSMGGASTWHLAVHYPDHWAAANPGAGFAETPRFSKFFHKEELKPTWWETKLFHLYDATDWAGNLWHCPTVAYSGELDTQKQAADVMAEALKKSGLELVHIIGPKTKHAYHPEAAKEVERRIAALAERGREVLPESIRFTTYTLRYNRCAWMIVDALDKHWERASIEARPDEDGGISVAPENVKAFTISIPAGYAPIRSSLAGTVSLRIMPSRIDTYAREPQVLPLHVLTKSDRSFTASLHRDGKHWVAGTLPATSLRKKHGLQGPIDDAFMDAFLMVRPTGNAENETVGKWAHSEMDRAVTEWRRQFRGTPRVKDDRDVTAKDIASTNLIVWGDPSSNSLLAQMAEKLPIRWEKSAIVAGERHFDAAHHAPILIYPNPLNPERYVVLNSGFTFREHAQFSNSYQVPKLPDWAIVDIRTPPDADWPGKIVAADFFDEEWKLAPPHHQSTASE